MAILTVDNLTKSFADKTIINDVSFQVDDGDKVAIIGANGVGKTSMFRMIVGEMEADSGKIYKSGDLRIAYLKQNVHIESDNSIFEECKKAYWRAFEIEKKMGRLEKLMGENQTKEELTGIMNEYQWLTDKFEEEGGLSYMSEIKGILKGMGFSEDRFDDPVNVLSGGEKSRLELAQMLSGRPDMLLLDEPTNHLDIDAIRFLENFISDFRGACMIISHDRYFLDKLVDRTFLIQGKKIHIYNCGYGEYTVRRAKDLEILERAYENQQEEIARQEEIIERLSKLGGSKRKRGISQSRSRQKLLDKMERIELPPKDQKQMSLNLTARYRSGNDVLIVEDLEKSFDGRSLFSNLSFYMGRGEKAGLIGPNGAGKTTLFRMIMKKEGLDSGDIRFGSAVKVAYFDQEQQTLDDENTVIEEFWSAYPQMDRYEVRSNLAKFQFKGDTLFRKVGGLSGGEKARLALLKLMLSQANLLLMDEPTNHLDMESREILENALRDYDGTVLAISHDRYFLNRVCNKIFHLSQGGIEEVKGNYDDYLAYIDSANKKKEENSGSAFMTETQKKKERKKEKLAKKEIRRLKTRMKEIDDRIKELTEKEAELQKKALDGALYENYEEAMSLHDRLSNIAKEKEELGDSWLELAMLFDEEDDQL